MENEFTFENPEYRKTYWHTCSHIMAQAVKRSGGGCVRDPHCHRTGHRRGLVLRL